MSMRKGSLAFATALLPSMLVGCSTLPQESPPDSGSGGLKPTTARALAYVAAEYAGPPASAVRERDGAEEFTSGGVGTELRFGAEGPYDGDLLVVAAGKSLDPDLMDCESEETRSLSGCVSTDQGMLMWEDEAPEADPGVVYIVVDKGESAALVFYSGTPITGDPRTLDLPIATEVLFALANDPRVDVTTSADAVHAGAMLPYWRTSAE